MSNNKNEKLPQSIINHYCLKFNYSNPKKKVRTLPLKASRLQGQNIQLPPTNTPTKHHSLDISQSLSLQRKVRKKVVKGLILPKQEVVQCTHFPARKIKTQEHQLLKYIQKLQNDQHNIERYQNHLEKQGFLRQQSLSPKGIKPHLKNRPKQHALKRRYCVNRQRGGYERSFEEDEYGQLWAISIKNPLM